MNHLDIWDVRQRVDFGLRRIPRRSMDEVLLRLQAAPGLLFADAMRLWQTSPESTTTKGT